MGEKLREERKSFRNADTHKKRTISSSVVGARGNITNKSGSQIHVGVAELNRLGDSDTILGNLGGTISFDKKKKASIFLFGSHLARMLQAIRKCPTCNIKYATTR
jgi:hypothetical protein